VSVRLSMSKMHSECLYAFRSDVDAKERPAGREARVGSATHTLAEYHVKGKTESPKIDPHDLAAATILFEGPLRGWLDKRDWTACEIGLRYDAEHDVTTLGPRRGDPGYEDIGPMVLPGTLDLVQVVDDAVWIADLKTGKKDNAHPEQLYAQAVAASRLYGVSTAFVGFVFARKTKCDEPEWEALDGDRLDAEAGRIRRKLRLVPTSEPVLGQGCFYCPARDVCPAQQRAPIGAEDLDAIAAF
jgi:hypothetical protein